MIELKKDIWYDGIVDWTLICPVTNSRRSLVNCRNCQNYVSTEVVKEDGLAIVCKKETNQGVR
jgi:hypothetical protein